jgi:hypothetical protein
MKRLPAVAALLAANLVAHAGNAQDNARNVSLPPSGGGTAHPLAAIAGQTVRPEDFGAYGDGARPRGYVAILAGSTTLYAAGAAFTAADVGKYIEVPGAGMRTTRGVVALPVQEPGNGYRSIPSCSVRANGSGATCAVAAMSVQGAALTSGGSGCPNGAQDFTVPAVSGGTAAHLLATVSGGTITGTPQVTNSGVYPTMPASLTGVSLTGVACTALPVVTLSMGVQAISVTAPGSGYTSAGAAIPVSPSWGQATAAYGIVQPAVQTLRTTIAGYTDAKHVTLADMAGTAVGTNETITYGHDDTAAIQAALDRNGFVELTGGHLYLARNLTFGSALSGWMPQTGLVSRGGTATLRAIAGGDPTWFIATPNWAAGAIWADNPIACEDVIFDGGSVAYDVATSQAWASLFTRCIAEGGLRYGWRLPSTSRNGTPVQSGIGSSRFRDSVALSNGGDGLRIDHQAATDTQITGGFWHDNGAWALYIGQFAGVLVNNVHTYSDGLGGLWADVYGGGSSVVNSLFEEPVTIGSLGVNYGAVFGPGNTLEGRLSINFSDNHPYESFTSLGNVYQLNGQIYQGYNGPGHTIYSVHDTFQSGNAFAWNGAAASTGVIVARDDAVYGHNGNPAAATFDGLMIPTAVPLAPNKIEFAKYLSDQATTTTFTITASAVYGAFPSEGFTLRGHVNAWSKNIADSAWDDFTVDLRAEYVRQQSGTGSAKAVQLLNPVSANGTISAKATISDTTNASGSNTVTIDISLTHPRAPDQYSSWATIHLESENRSVTSLTVR